MEPDQSFELRDGDLAFQDLAGTGAAAIESVTPGYQNAEVSHVGIFLRIGSTPYVVEAFPPEVRLTPWAVFLRRAKDQQGRPRVFMGRIRRQHRDLIPRALKKAISLRGLPYDRVYLSGEDAYYCSELVVDAFKSANGGVEFFPERPMSFSDPRTGLVLDYWRRYYEYFGLEVPVGQRGSNPGQISLSTHIEVLHRYGFLTNWH